MGKIAFAIISCVVFCFGVMPAQAATYANPNYLFAFSYDYKIDKIEDDADYERPNYGIVFKIGEESIAVYANAIFDLYWDPAVGDTYFQQEVRDCKEFDIDSWFQKYYLCQDSIGASRVGYEHSGDIFTVWYRFEGEPKNMELFFQIMKSYTLISWREASKYFDPELAEKVMEAYERLHRERVRDAYERRMNNN